jgi:AraC-like DNA-binding protein
VEPDPSQADSFGDIGGILDRLEYPVDDTGVVMDLPIEGGAEAVDEAHRPEAGMRAGAAAPAGTIGLSGIGSDRHPHPLAGTFIPAGTGVPSRRHSTEGRLVHAATQAKAAGNMTTGNGSTIGYTGYNLPNVIMAGSNPSTLYYGASRNRYKQVTVTSGVSETTIYVGGLLEKVTRGSVIEYRHLIHSGKGVAAALGMSLRILHRRLGEEKVGCQQLLDEVRSSMAIEYLQNTLMPVEEICHRIGFTDASSLRKALRRWTGNPARAYRRPVSAN